MSVLNSFITLRNRVLMLYKVKFTTEILKGLRTYTISSNSIEQLAKADKSKLHVSNLPTGCSKEDLTKLFSGYGDVIYSEVINDKGHVKSKLNISNLPTGVTKEDLTNLFSEYGEVIYAEGINDQGHVVMNTENEAKEAQIVLHKAFYKGVCLKVELDKVPTGTKRPLEVLPSSIQHQENTEKDELFTTKTASASSLSTNVSQSALQVLKCAKRILMGMMEREVKLFSQHQGNTENLFSTNTASVSSTSINVSQPALQDLQYYVVDTSVTLSSLFKFLENMQRTYNLEHLYELILLLCLSFFLNSC